MKYRGIVMSIKSGSIIKRCEWRDTYRKAVDDVNLLEIDDNNQYRSIESDIQEKKFLK
jgi:hypothetical protein